MWKTRLATLCDRAKFPRGRGVVSPQPFHPPLRGSSIHALELENAVLRHEVRVLRRQRRSVRLRRLDRVVLAAASRAIPRDRWSLFVVRPQTLLRWHRELVRRKWTYRRRGGQGP